MTLILDQDGKRKRSRVILKEGLKGTRRLEDSLNGLV